MAGRQIDWKAWINALVYCYGCGRFTKTTKSPIPRGWKLLYQPHPEGKPGLHVCSDECAGKVREAMSKGPIVEPLEMSTDLGLMPADVREAMEEDMKRAVAGELMSELLAGGGEIDGVTGVFRPYRDLDEYEQRTREVFEPEGVQAGVAVPQDMERIRHLPVAGADVVLVSEVTGAPRRRHRPSHEWREDPEYLRESGYKEESDVTGAEEEQGGSPSSD